MVPFQIPDRYEYAGSRFRGGQGFVSIYRDTYLDRLVAIKFMRELSQVDSLRSELAALQDIHSRHIVQVYDFLHARRSPQVALVQEFVPGPSLDDYIAAADLETSYLKTLWQITSGLSDIHAHGKVHRDIKPSNVRFDSEGIAKILDFGLVTELSITDQTLHARGTRRFLAPELYGNPPIKVTTAIDVYCFGVLAWYTALKGKLPGALREEPPQSSTPLPSISMSPVTLPPDLTELLDSCLSIDPDKRPKMDVVRASIEKHLLAGRHRMTILSGGNKSVLSTPGQAVTLRVGGTSLLIRYDGLSFIVEETSGLIYVNNIPARPKDVLPASCVITIDSGSQSREFVSVNVSSPGVVL